MEINQLISLYLIQRIYKIQNNFEKESKTGVHYLTLSLTIKLEQSCPYDTGTMTGKQINGTKESRNKPRYMWSIDFYHHIHQDNPVEKE